MTGGLDACDLMAAGGLVSLTLGCALFSVRLALVVLGALLFCCGTIPVWRSTSIARKAAKRERE